MSDLQEVKERKKEVEQRKMHPLTKGAARALVILFDTIGTILALYIGGYVMFLRVLYRIVTGYQAGTLLLPDLLRGIISIVLAATIGGAIWCVFDIIASLFREREE